MILENLKNALIREDLVIGPNSYEAILDLYNSDENFARLSNNFPVKMETIKEEVSSIPPFTSLEKKHYISIYNFNRELVAVLDLIEEYSFKNKHGKNAIWIGLLQIDKKKQNTGLGKIISKAIFESCRENGIEFIQLGVIKENDNAFKFWTNVGFETFAEVNNGDFDLYLMEKIIE